ncbi:MAG TPA: carboxypeptidase-like regulatory domain-containing protein [Blastocatellia bacterium]
MSPGTAAKVWWTTRDVTAPAAAHETHFLSDIKTLVSVGDSQLRVAALCDITVIQGEPEEFKIPLPAGFEVTEVSGTTLDSSETLPGFLILKVQEPARRNHQFLVAIEQKTQGPKVDTPFLSFDGSQRETGEVLVEGAGTMELSATEGGGLRRIDISEVGAITRSMARFPLQAGFRYHRQPGLSPALHLEWTQFPDSPVLSAIAERATVTTLMNTQGRSLTEVELTVRNHAQSFLKVELPKGATILSAEVEGERVKPFEAPDGSRVPLLRTGHAPSGTYTVSFVYMNSGAALGKSGTYDMSLPKLDVPVGILNWEVSLPERLVVTQFGGDAIPSSTLGSAGAWDGKTDENFEAAAISSLPEIDSKTLSAGEMVGIVTDQSQAIIPGASVKIVNAETGATVTATTNSDGEWIARGLPSGLLRVTVDSGGFKSQEEDVSFQAQRPVRLATTLAPGSASETVTVNGARAASNRDFARIEEQSRKNTQSDQPSQNVFNLQKRVNGILPVRVDVPKGGKSYWFVRPLVLNEETTVSFHYKLK